MNITLFTKRAACVGVVLAGILVAGLASLPAGQADAQTAPSEAAPAPAADIPAALAGVAQELGCSSKGSCEAVCSANLSKCIEVSERLNIYSSEEKQLATSFKREVLNKLKDVTEEDFEERIVSIARDLVRSKPSLAKQFDIDKTKVAAADAIVKEVKSAGTDVSVCSRSVESLSRDQLVSCLNASKRLAEKSETVRPYIREDRLKQAGTSDALLHAQKNGLLNGCGDGTLESCGQFCFDPAKTSQGEGAIPQVCLNLARTVFKDEGGEESLRNGYRGIKEAYDMQLRVADRITLTTPDGRALRGKDQIRDACDGAFQSGDIALAKSCGEFAVNNGFVRREEMEEGLKFLESVAGKGQINFKDCRQNPQACERFIPQEARGEFQAMRQIEDVMRSEMGFDPRECQNAAFDPSIGERCLQGSKRALAKLEGTVTGTEAGRILGDIRRHVEEGERFSAKQSEFQGNFAGPGGCRGPEECFKYCTDSAHGPECLSFGAQSGLIDRGDVRGRFEQYQGHLQTGAFPGAPYGPGGAASGTPYGGPQSGQYGGQIPPGDFRSSPQGGPGGYQGFGPPGFGPGGPGVGIGPGPECFRAIESGDFEKAKELCRSGFPGGPGFAGNVQYPGPGGEGQQGPYPGGPNYPTRDSYPRDYRPQSCQAGFPSPCPAGQERRITYENGCPVYRECAVAGTEPGTGPQICPAMPTVDSCPSGERKEVSYSSPGCGTYYRCVQEGQEGVPPPPPGPGPYPDPATECARSGGTWSGSYCSRYPSPGSTSTYYSDPAEGCRHAGGSWNGSYCQMPGTGPGTSCPSGQYWYVPSGGGAGYCRSSSETPTTPSPSGQREQIWNSLGLRSWVRADASQSRIDSLKAACANVASGHNVWMPAAGDSSSQDFGMPDPDKCRQAGSCTSSQYFNGSSCVSSGSGGGNSSSTYGTTCPSGQYWNGSACVSSGTSCPSGQYWNGSSCTSTSASTSCPSDIAGLLGDGCHNMENAYFDGPMLRYVYPGSTTVKNCSSDYLSGCSGGTSSASCPSGQYWNGSTCANSTGTTSSTSGSGGTSCPSGQYWNGSTCVNSTSGTGGTTCSSGQYWDGHACVNSPSGYTGGYSSDSATACSQAGGSWDSSRQYCVMPGSTSGTGGTSCSSGQYWNGTSCVTSNTTTCPSGQYWNGSACVSSSPSTSCPSGQYWNGSSCVSSTSGSTSGSGGGTYATDPATSCAQAGGSWNGSSCTMPSSGTTSGSTSGSYTPPPSGSGSYTPPPSEPAPSPTPTSAIPSSAVLMLAAISKLLEVLLASLR